MRRISGCWKIASGTISSAIGFVSGRSAAASKVIAPCICAIIDICTPTRIPTCRSRAHIRRRTASWRRKLIRDISGISELQIRGYLKVEHGRSHLARGRMLRDFTPAAIARRIAFLAFLATLFYFGYFLRLHRVVGDSRNDGAARHRAGSRGARTWRRARPERWPAQLTHHHFAQPADAFHDESASRRVSLGASSVSRRAALQLAEIAFGARRRSSL